MKTEQVKQLNWYKYESPKIRILWNGNIQPMGVFKTAEEAAKAIYDISKTEQQVKEFSIQTPDGLIKYEQFKN